MNPTLIQQACERTLIALTIATTKPSPRGDSSGGGGAIEPPLPLPVGIISAKRELRDILLLWTDLVSDGMDVVANCDPTDTSMLEWLAGNERATFLAAHDAGMDFLEEITTITKSLENPYQPKQIRTFLGIHGGGEVHVKENQKTVELEDGTIEHVESIRAWNADAMRQAEGTAKEVAEMIWEFYGQYIKPRLIADTRNNDANPRSKKEHKLESIRKEGREHIYRVQDVLDRLTQNENTVIVDNESKVL